MFATGTKRIFVCTNKRRSGRSCGMQCDTVGIAKYLEKRLDEAGEVAGEIELRKTRCLGRCLQGPILGILPDNVWYRYEDQEDIDEIVAEHIEGGDTVERLLVRRAVRPTGT